MRTSSKAKLYLSGRYDYATHIGHWSVRVVINGKEKHVSGHELRHDGSASFPFLKAALEGLKLLDPKVPVEIRTNCGYLVGIMSNQEKIDLGRKQKWMTRSGNPYKSYDVWKEIDPLLQCFDIKWINTGDYAYRKMSTAMVKPARERNVKVKETPPVLEKPQVLNLNSDDQDLMLKFRINEKLSLKIQICPT